jgi:opacity protein-like surface antigen
MSRNHGDATIWLWNVNLDYNILRGRLTSFLTGGIGVFGWSGDWDAGGRFRECNFSHNLGVGGRWDITDNIALKVLCRAMWTEVEGADDPLQFDGVTANLVCLFK